MGKSIDAIKRCYYQTLKSDGIERRIAATAATSKFVLPKSDWPLVGLGVPYGDFSADLGGFREFFSPGAFTRSLQQRADVPLLYDHNPAKVLARTSVGTMRLWESAEGLFVEARPVDTTLSRDVQELVATRHVRGLSVGFRLIGDRWSENSLGEIIRQVIEAELYELSVVLFPAYASTTVSWKRSASVAENKSRFGADSSITSLPCDRTRYLKELEYLAAKERERLEPLIRRDRENERKVWALCRGGRHEN